MERIPDSAIIRKRLPLFVATLALAFLPTNRIEPSQYISRPSVWRNNERLSGYPPGSGNTAVVILAQEASPVQQTSGVDCDKPIILGADVEGNPIIQDPQALGLCLNEAQEDHPITPVINPGRPDPTLA